MYSRPVKKIVILGGGTAGWMAAAAISERFIKENIEVRVIESPDVATVGVGEATVPSIRRFHKYLEIPETDFIRATKATFKLGIEFRDWYRPGSAFFHPFSSFGATIAHNDFFQCWLKLRHHGYSHELEDYCLSVRMARMGRFAQPDGNATSELARYNYAYHFDASLYAAYLRNYADKRGVQLLSDTVVSINTDSQKSIESVVLRNGAIIEGDLFIDCSGFRSLLLGQSLGVSFNDWSDLLPCDRAVVVQSEGQLELPPYTVSSARSAGWQWRIPLEHRVGNGYVYCSNFISDEDAEDELVSHIEGAFLSEPRVLNFKAGMREVFWQKNCVALGLASGFIEPLESTSISLIQTGIEKLLQFMPDLMLSEENIAEANRLNRLEYEQIRDFIVLHYISSQRQDGEFWRHMAGVNIPETLQRKLDAFDRDGSILLYEQESFVEPSWIAMYNGFRRYPKKHDPSVDRLDSGKLNGAFDRMSEVLAEAAEAAQGHREFLRDVYI